MNFSFDISALSYREKELPIHLPVLEIFKRLRKHHDTVFFLESLGEDEFFSRYSYIGFAPQTIITAHDNGLEMDGIFYPTLNPYVELSAFFARFSQLQQDHFCGGLVGYLNYEATKFFEPGDFYKKHSHFPDFQFGLYLDGLIFEKKTQKLRYFYLLEDRSESLSSILSQPLSMDVLHVAKTHSRSSEQEFLNMVQQAQTHIQKGDSFQVVVSRSVSLEIQGDSMFFYERLREMNPSPHMFFLCFGDRELIGSSPELIVRLEKGEIVNFPLAGTRARGSNHFEDESLASELLSDVKERAEHMMLVDLGRNDVGKVSSFGSVQVRKFMQIRRYAHVQHIGSEIVGNIAPHVTMFDVLAANCPMGTVSGAPKVETMKIIAHLEKEARGPYAGSVGFFSFNGYCNFAIMIRSLFRYGAMAYIQSGAGVVYDSKPNNEYLETEKKLQSLYYALGI